MINLLTDVIAGRRGHDLSAVKEYMYQAVGRRSRRVVQILSSCSLVYLYKEQLIRMLKYLVTDTHTSLSYSANFS